MKTNKLFMRVTSEKRCDVYQSRSCSSNLHIIQCVSSRYKKKTQLCCRSYRHSVSPQPNCCRHKMKTHQQRFFTFLLSTLLLKLFFSLPPSPISPLDGENMNDSADEIDYNCGCLWCTLLSHDTRNGYRLYSLVRKH